MSGRLHKSFASVVAVFLWLGVCGTAGAQPLRPSTPPPIPKPDVRTPGQTTPQAPRADDAAPLPKADAPATNTRPPESGYLGLATDDPQAGAEGLRVIEAVAGSPAAKAGLKAGDRIVEINSAAVHGTKDMAAVLDGAGPGAEVLFRIDRDGTLQNIAVTLGKRPQRSDRRFDKAAPSGGETLPEPVTPPGDAAGTSGPARLGPPTAGGPTPPSGRTPVAESVLPHKALLGVRTQPVTDEVRQRLQLPPNTQGALVVGRTLGSPADAAGIPIDAVIVSLAGTAINSPQELAREVSRLGATKSAEVVYLAGGETRRTRVVLKELAGEPASTAPSDTPLAPAPVTPPKPAAASPFADNDRDGRIEALEQRIRELELRVKELESRK